MVEWSVVYRENNSFYIEAHDNYSKYHFSSHALERVLERSYNLKRIEDLGKPVKRIAKCLSHYVVDDWVLKHPFGTRLIIHDCDIKMMYIVVCNETDYSILSIFNECYIKYDNTCNTPEYWVSLLKIEQRRREIC